MTIKPGEVYRVDLGIKGKVRLMVVVSRKDPDAPMDAIKSALKYALDL